MSLNFKRNPLMNYDLENRPVKYLISISFDVWDNTDKYTIKILKKSCVKVEYLIA